MIFNTYMPARLLQPYIEMYWHVSGIASDRETITLLPDGGMTLLINLGNEVWSTRFNKAITKNTVFVVGPMLYSDIQKAEGETNIVGVKFRPGAFPSFYRYHNIDELADQFLEFPLKGFPDLNGEYQNFPAHFDRFFLDRFVSNKAPLLPIVQEIVASHGRIRVEQIVKKYFITERSLERTFKDFIGLTPKEYIDIERFNHAVSKILTRGKDRIFDISLECGYYDHAHLTNDFKRYTGQSPTALFLSDFSKSITDPLA